MEGGQPIVVWKEHDDDSQPWVGRHEGTGAGFGWFIFISPDAIPKLEHVDKEPHVNIPNFGQIKEKVTASLQSWKGYLVQPTASLHSAPASVQHKLREWLAAAVEWWETFLQERGSDGQLLPRRSCFVKSQWLPYPSDVPSPPLASLPSCPPHDRQVPPLEQETPPIVR